MAEGVLPFVRGLDLTRNDFKVAISNCFNFSVEGFNPWASVFISFVEAGFSETSGRYAKFEMVEVEQDRFGGSTGWTIPPHETGKEQRITFLLNSFLSIIFGSLAYQQIIPGGFFKLNY